MPTYVPPKKNTAFVFYTALVSRSNPNVFQSNPTLATGDVKVAIDDGSLSNLATLPSVSPAGSKLVKVSLSADEMNGDNITVVFSDAAGDEWQDQIITIQTVGSNQIDDLATPATVWSYNSGSGRTLTSFGTLIADIWSYVSGAGRTLTSFGSLVSDVRGEVDDALADYDPPTKAEMDAAFSALNDISTTEVRTEVDAGIAAALTNIASAVWSFAGSLGSALVATLQDVVWSATGRTLTQTAAEVQEAMTGTNIVIHRGDTWAWSLTGLGDIRTRTKLYFTLKSSTIHSDAEALVQIEETAGLLRLNGAAATDAMLGDITVNDATEGDITITLSAAATAQLQEASNLVYDVQMITPDGVDTLTQAKASVTADVTRAVS